MHEFEKVGSRAFFYKPLKRFVNRKFGNAWQLAFNRVHETPKKFVCNPKIMSLGAIWI